MTRGDWIALAVLVGVTALALAAGARRGRFAATALASTAVLTVLWAAAVLLTASGWRDADGWIDCQRSCTPLQDAIGVVVVFGAALTVVVAVAAAVGMLVGARRR